MSGLNDRKGNTPHGRRNRITADPLMIAVVLAAVAVLIIVVATVIAINKKKESEGMASADHGVNVALYFEDGSEMLGGELVDGMEKLEGASVAFAVKTLSSDGTAYYNRSADGKEVPAYAEPVNKADPNYIRGFGKFVIHISTDVNGLWTVSAVQTE